MKPMAIPSISNAKQRPVTTCQSTVIRTRVTVTVQLCAAMALWGHATDAKILPVARYMNAFVHVSVLELGCRAARGYNAGWGM